MGISVIAMNSMTWMKDMSTSYFRRTRAKLFQIEFIRQNLKSLVVCSIIWLIVTIGGYFVLCSAVKQLDINYNQRGSSLTLDLAPKISQALLERDILSMNAAIGEIDNDILYVTILDHKNKIVAHSDPEMTDRPFNPLKNIKDIETVRGVSIKEGITSNDKKATSFSTNVYFTDTLIGKIHLVTPASHLYSSRSKYRTIYISVVVSSLLLFSIILIAINRTATAKKLRLQQEHEATTSLGPYKFQKKLAQGGMAELFLADYVRRDGFRRVVVVKRILSHFAQDPVFVNMFIREAKLAALLRHPNIVQVADFGKIKDAYFIAMEYIDGMDLGEIMVKVNEGLQVDQAIYIALHISAGLQYSHTKKDEKTNESLEIVHRDISPQNILISFQGEVKITDFGISKARSEPNLTQAGEVKGKLSYMSPEQALGENIDHRTDIYALGIVLYEMLTRKKLYSINSGIEAIRTIPEKVLTPLIQLRPDIPEELNNIVMKCLEKDKELRYQNAQELFDDLNSLKVKLGITYDVSDLAGFMKKYPREKTISQDK